MFSLRLNDAFGILRPSLPLLYPTAQPLCHGINKEMIGFRFFDEEKEREKVVDILGLYIAHVRSFIPSLVNCKYANETGRSGGRVGTFVINEWNH